MISRNQITMFTVSLALFMDVLDTNVINTAVPAMAHSLQVSPIDLKIALISYLLSLAIFIPISGWAADKYGVKPIFICALGLFTLSSFWCGYAHSLLGLVVARSVQGVGGAFMISLGRLIIVRTFERHQLVEAMNTVVIVISFAVMLGPFIGGVITEYLSWPWIFWLNIPAGLLAMLLAFYGLKDTAKRSIRPFDLLGFILFGGGLAMLCFSLSALSESNINFYYISAMFLLAVMMLIGYLIHALKHSHPVIKIQLFKIRTFRISVFGNLFARLGFGGMPFLLPLLQQVGLGFSAEVSGLLLVPMAFGIIFSKLLAARILRKIGYRFFLISNTLLVGFVLWSYQIIGAHTSVYTIATLTFILGICMSAQFTAMNSLAFADIEPDELSASTSITSTAQVLAQTLGVAVAAILLRYYSISSQQDFLSTNIFHHTFFAMGVITFIAATIFIGLRKGDGKQMLAIGEIKQIANKL